MEMNTAQFNQLLDALKQSNQGFSMEGGSAGRSTSRDDKSRAKEAANMIGDNVEEGVKDGLRTLPKKLSEAIDKSGNILAKKLSESAKGLEGVLKIEDQITAMRQISSGLQEIEKGNTLSKAEMTKELARLEEVANRAGLSFEDLGIKTKRVSQTIGKNGRTVVKASEAIEKLDETADSLTESMEEANTATKTFTRKTAKESSFLGNSFKQLAGIVKNSSKIALEEIKLSDQRAVADMGFIKGLTSMGLNQLSYGKFLAETRQQQLSMATAGVDFTEQLESSSTRLRRITSDPEEAAKVQAQLMKNASLMGISAADFNDAIDEQITAYEKNGRAFGQSALESAKFTEEMLKDSEIQAQVTRLRGKERAAFVLGIVARQKELRMMGYTAERAIGVQKALAALEGMSPKERLKASAKKRAMLGALGMGQEGARLMELENKVRYEADPAKKKAMQDEITNIMAKASNLMIEKSGGGANPAAAFAMEEMAIKTGFAPFVKVFETTSGEGNKINEDQLKELNTTNAHLTDIKNAANLWQQAQKSGVASVGTGIAAAVGGALATVLGKGALKKVVGFISGKPGGGPGITSKIGSKMGSMVNTGKNMAAGAATMASNVAGKGVDMAKNAGGKIKTAGSLGAKMGKAGLKSAIKKIPIIGALAGIGFGLSRAMDGDMVGAGLEIASGVASIIPGFGTAASLAIDGGLLARDMAMEQEGGAGGQSPKEDQAAVYERAVKKREEKDTALLSTLTELQTYLKNINEQNSEQAEAMNNTGNAINESLRWNKAPDPQRA